MPQKQIRTGLRQVAVPHPARKILASMALATVLLGSWSNVAITQPFSNPPSAAANPEGKRYQAGLNYFKAGKFQAALEVFQDIQVFYQQQNNFG